MPAAAAIRRARKPQERRKTILAPRASPGCGTFRRSEGARAPRKVLVADDDRLLVGLLQKALSERGYRVFVAFDGMQALDQVRREPPDYLVLDLVMPKVDGIQVCLQLKEDPRLRSIPIIVLTGTASESAECLSYVRADAYVAKRDVDATLHDLFMILRAFEDGVASPAWAQQIQGLGAIQPRRIVTELLAHTAHFNALFQNLGEGILFLDSSHRILFVNPAGAALLHCPERNLVGQQLSTVLEAQETDPLLLALKAMASQEGLATQRLVYAYRDRTLHLTITNLLGEEWAGGQLVLIRDISPLFRRIRELAAMNEVSALLTATLDVDKLFLLIMERIQALMGVEASSLLLKDDERDELVFRVGLGEYGEAVKGRRLKVGQGIAGWVFQHGSALIVPDVRQDSRFYQGVDYHTGFTTKSILCVPLKTHEKVMGVIQVLNGPAHRPFDQDDLNLLSAIAAHAATAIENARLYTEVKSYAESLERKVEERTRELETANARIEKTLVQAEEASRHKSTFLANVSHELRIPLNSIIGFSEVLRDQHFGPLTAKQARHVQNIHKAGHQLLQLINDLLDLSKVEVGRVELHRQPVRIGPLIAEAVAMIRDQAGKNDLLVESLPGEPLPCAYADPYRVTQILTNLLSNAVKFTPSGGRVTVSARMVQSSGFRVQGGEEGRYEPSTMNHEHHGDFVEIAVRDTGIGIRPEDQTKLFQPFMRLEAVAGMVCEGTGLGLVITRRLVEMHGGRIWVQSEGEGRGSTFAFTLPVAGQAAWEVATPEVGGISSSWRRPGGDGDRI
jgi:signal transduction histidine kinase/ActR/RegA family two-component response regulator